MPLPEHELDELFNVDLAKVEGSVSAMAAHYLEVRRAKEDTEKKLSDMNAALETAELYLMNKMEEQGLLSIKIDCGDSTAHISTTTATSYRLRGGDLESVRAWLVEHGGAPIIKEGVQWQSFESFCRELAQQGEVMPEQVIVTARRVIRLRKATAIRDLKK